MQSLILFFVASGRVTDAHKSEAAALSEKTGKTVVFRNASLARATGENPEPCAGCFGDIPDNYAARFPTYDAKGNATPAPEGFIEGLGEVNALGLPKGCPEDRNELKAALRDHGVEFHPNTKTETLAELFKTAVLAD